MHSTPDTTRSYHRRHTGLHTTLLGRTGLMVSGAGFGGYRISSGVEAHHEALRMALTSGINLIDTSANYADGASEELIGETIAELVRAGTIARNQIVIVSKGGYIQGANYTMAKERSRQGEGFPDVVEYAEGLWHCISPEFLEDQITRSLDRLGLQTIDVYLLHNPEYYLNWASKHGVRLEEARREYYRRIRSAFEHLEKEVEKGRIIWYGISSNSFPHSSESADFTSLDELITIAESISPSHHFAVIQFPANAGERGFVTERNQSGGRSLIDVVREKSLGVLINRPLNVIHNDRLIRMADFPDTEVIVTQEVIESRCERLITAEREFHEIQLDAFADDPEGQRAMQEFITIGHTVQQYWPTFGSIEQFNDIMSQHFAPRLGFVSQYLRRRGDEKRIDWYAGYLNDARALLHIVSRYYSRDAQKRSRRIREEIARHVEVAEGDTLSSLSIRLLLGVEGVDCVLVGMRRGEYVEDVLDALREGPLGTEETWKELDISSAIDEAEEEVE